MFKKGLATLVILLFLGLAISPSIYADKERVSIDVITETDAFDFDGYTPIQLVFLLINKLRYYEGIESEEDVLEIIYSDAELNGIVEELKSYSCGCEDEDTIDEWTFPVICLILAPIIFYFLMIYFWTRGAYGRFIVTILSDIGTLLNCFWKIN